jgi:hypothetical protein
MLDATHYRDCAGKGEARRNPFTGEMMIDDGRESFTPDAEFAAVRAFLARYDAFQGKGFEVWLPNALVSSSLIDGGGALLGLRGDSAVWAPFLFELASAGDFVIHSMNFGPGMTTSTGARDRLSAESYPDKIVVVTSGADIAAYLADEYRATTEWIARVVKP